MPSISQSSPVGVLLERHDGLAQIDLDDLVLAERSGPVVGVGPELELLWVAAKTMAPITTRMAAMPAASAPLLRPPPPPPVRLGARPRGGAPRRPGGA